MRVEIEGLSMVPTLAPGEWWLARRTRKIHPGDLVVIAAQGDLPMMVKRAVVRYPDGWWVEADNPAGQDSRDFGLVEPHRIEAVLWRRYGRRVNGR